MDKGEHVLSHIIEETKVYILDVSDGISAPRLDTVPRIKDFQDVAEIESVALDVEADPPGITEIQEWVTANNALHLQVSAFFVVPPINSRRSSDSSSRKICRLTQSLLARGPAAVNSLLGNEQNQRTLAGAPPLALFRRLGFLGGRGGGCRDH